MRIQVLRLRSAANWGGGIDVHVGLVGYLVGDVDGGFAGLPSPGLLPTTYFSELVTPTSGLSLSQFGVYA